MQQFTLCAQPRLLRFGLASGKLTLKRHPLISKALPTAVGFAFGDCLTQVRRRGSCVALAPFGQRVPVNVKPMWGRSLGV